jgi:transcriptional regulator NrdR family protein
MNSNPSPFDCPACGSGNRHVFDSRRLSDRIRRRCTCTDCTDPPRWITYEITEEHLKRLESSRVPVAGALQTARLISVLDRFRARLVASLPDHHD